MTRKRIMTLEIFRLICCLLIVLGHFQFLYENQTVSKALKLLVSRQFTVGYFFILSGFGLMLAYNKEEKPYEISIKESIIFAFKKIKKLYIVFLFSYLLILPFHINNIVINVQNGESIYTHIFKTLFVLTLFQSVMGKTSFSEYMCGPWWFLSTLTIIYLFAPIMMKYTKKFFNTVTKSVIGLVITFFFIILVYFIFVKIEERVSFFNSLSYTSPYYRIFFVFIGMIIANLVSQIKHENHDFTFYEILSLITVVFIGAIDVLFDISVFLSETVSVFGCILIVFVFGLNKGKISEKLNTKTNLNIGKLTMELYLLHIPAREYATALSNLIAIKNNNIFILVNFILCVVFIIVFTVMIKLIQRLLYKKTTTSGTKP